MLNISREVGETEWLEIVIGNTSCGEGERVSNRTAGRIEAPFEVSEHRPILEPAYSVV